MFSAMVKFEGEPFAFAVFAHQPIPPPADAEGSCRPSRVAARTEPWATWSSPMMALEQFGSPGADDAGDADDLAAAKFERRRFGFRDAGEVAHAQHRLSPALRRRG